MKKLPKFTIGMGDRFAHQGEAQLSAVQSATERGVPLHPVWNKSNREHTLIGTKPEGLRAEADAAVKALNWTAPYFVDADHINLHTVDGFLVASDFFTLDVADYSGKPASPESMAAFLEKRAGLVGLHHLPLLDAPLEITRADLERTAGKFLWAMQEAGRIYRHIADAKPADAFAVEVSVDETDTPQTPGELLIILAMIADEGIPAQTIAPKFTGRFNKGVDYVGDIAAFEREFDADLAVLAYAVREFGLPDTLKISVHSGSDKFSLYPIINRLIKKHGCGLHVKTAGTTWLEEVIGLAEAGEDGLAVAKEIYAGAHLRFEELTAPYATVIDINPMKLPSLETVAHWASEQFVAALQHDSACPDYNPDFRQLIHVGFKVAAELGTRYTACLKKHSDVVGSRVTSNLLERHIQPIFG